MGSQGENIGLLTLNIDEKFDKINESIRKKDANELSELKVVYADILFSPQDAQYKNTSLHIACKHEANDCLRVLLGCNPTKESIDLPNADGDTALHLAAATSNQEAIAILLKNGAYLGGTNLHNVLPTTIETAMDNCITDNHSNVFNQDYELEIDYSVLIHETNDESQKIFNESKLLFDISETEHLRNTIKHPLVRVFLDARFNKVFILHLITLLLYSIFVILLTVFMYYLKNQRILEKNLENCTTNCSSMEPLWEKKLSFYQTRNSFLKIFILLITLYMAIKEVFQMYVTSYKSYFFSIENYLELFLISSALISCFYPLSVAWTRHLAAWTVVGAW